MENETAIFIKRFIIIMFFTFLGAKKRLRLLRMDKSDAHKKKKYDPNVIGLEDSTDDESDSETSDTSLVEEINLSPVKESDEIKNDCENILTTEDKHIKEVIDISEENTKNNESEIKTINNNVNNSKTTKKNTFDNDKVNKDVKPLLDCPKTRVEIKRDPKVQVARLKLPILGEEQRIMEIINENEIIIVAGETGMNFLLKLWFEE